MRVPVKAIVMLIVLILCSLNATCQTITSLSPNSGAAGTTVTIQGAQFGASQTSGTVFFGPRAATVSSWNDSTITVVVPSRAATGNVVVKAGSGVSSSGVLFTVIPSVTGLSPNSAAIGSLIAVSGSSFGGSTGSVTFNGVNAPLIISWTPTSIVAAVPAGATSGNVVITSSGGTASNPVSFTVVPPPNILNLSPNSGSSGLAVTINGTNFGATQGSGSVTFNGTFANITSWSDAAIVAVVPFGATGGNVVVTPSGGVHSNGVPFAIGNVLNTSRYSDTAALLNNGKVLLAGGLQCPTSGNCNYLASAEIFDPASNAFTNTGSMAGPRSAPAVLLSNGNVLIAGGYTCDSSGNCTSLSSAEIFNPSSGTFSSAGNMSIGRTGHTMTHLNNGEILIAGGKNCTAANACATLNSAELYDPVANTFTLSNSTLISGRYGAAATILSDGNVLIAGGFDGTNLTNTGEIYSTQFDSFSIASNLNTGRYQPSVTLLNDGRVLVAGGSTCGQSNCPTNTAEIFNKITQAFVSTTGTMNVARFNHTATLLNNGQVLLAGGLSGCTSSCTSESSSELFDPVAGTFASGQSLVSARAGHTATLLQNGNVLLGGGISGGVTAASSESYQPARLTPPSLVSIAITPGNRSFLPGATLQLTATGTFSGGSTQTLQSVTWTSSDNTVATVTDDTTDHGAAYAIANGSVTVTACAGSICGSTTLRVGPAILTSIAVAPTSDAVPLGIPQKFGATGIFSDGTNRDLSATVAWTSANIQIATVSAIGLTTGISVGTTTIQAASGPISSSASITVQPPVLLSLAVAPALGGSIVGGTEQFTVAGTFSDGSMQDLTASASWSSTRTSVATINGSGLSTGVGVGSAVIQARVGGVTASSSLNVTALSAQPTITAAVSPALNANGWNNTNTTVTFTCAAGSAAIVTCPGPQIVSSEGANQIVSGRVTDAAGGTATTSVTLNVDKTAPVLSVTSPLDGDTVSGANIAVTGPVSDALSGLSTVTCNGSAAAITGSVFSCNVSLNGGANLIVVRATDIAGNVAASRLRLSLSAPLPVPISLSVTPSNVVMPVGGSKDFTAFGTWLPANCNGCSGPIVRGVRSDASWSVSDSTIGTLVTNGDGTATLTAVNPGTATVTATVQGVSAQTTVKVVTSISPGTILWSPAPTAGTGFVTSVQAQWVSGAPDLFTIESGNDGIGQPKVVVRAFTTQGQQLWATQLTGNSLFMNVVPDANGGVLLDFVRGVGGLPKLIDLDGQTGAELWEYVHQSGLEDFAGPLGRELALTRDGKIYMREIGFNSNTGVETSNLVSVDGETGASTTLYTVPRSKATLRSACGGGDQVIPNNSSQISNPVIAHDGTIFVTTLDYQEVDGFPCGGGEFLITPGATISLVEISPGTASPSAVTPIHELSSPLADGSFPVVGLFDILPDDNGSAFAVWGFVSSRNQSVNEMHLAHGSADTMLPLQYDDVAMVLGDQGTLFAANSTEVAAMNLSGGTRWTAMSPSGQSVKLLAASAGGGVVAKYTANTIDRGEIVVRFDANGNSSLDTWTAASAINANTATVTGLQYFGGDQWLVDSMMVSSGAPIEFSNSDWFQVNQGGTNQAAQHVNVTGASTSGTNQSAIVSALRGIKTILDADARSQSPNYSDCRTWLGANAAPLMQLFLTGDNGHSYNIGHGTFWWGDTQRTSADNIGAFTGGLNADLTAVTGLPTVGFGITVNDNGAFFNERAANNHPWQVGPRHYAGNGLRAQAAMLVHELSHGLADGHFGSAGFQHDMGLTTAGRDNDRLVDQHCRRAIEDLDTWFWIETPWLPPGALNTAYSATLTARGGQGPYTWSVTQGALPNGLTLSGSTGAISGTPTASGTTTFTVQVRDSTAAPNTRTASEQYSIEIR